MNNSLKTLGLASTAALVLSLSARATTYNGNGSTGFGGPVGSGSLTFTSGGGMLTGTVTPGPNNGAGNNGQLYDELVVYISTGATGFNSTVTLTDTTTNNGILAKAVSGYDGTTRATINFATGFAARYAIALSPTNAMAGELFGLTTAGAFTAIQPVNLTPVSGAGNPNYTFGLSLSNIGSPTSFSFSTTYLNAHPNAQNATSVFRSNEAFNSLTDTGNPANTANPGTDTITLGVDTFAFVVPEPGTWAMLLGGIGLLIGWQRRPRRV